MSKKAKSKHLKEKKESLLKKIILMILLIVFTVLFIISGMKIVNYLKDATTTNKIIDDISKSIEVQKVGEEDIYNIDFTSLKEKNSDTIGFVKVNGTEIEHVVVKAKNNDFYLSHDFEKNENIEGWIFADYRNKLDGNDKNIIIYGHNMKNNNMFGTLKNILNDDWKDVKENRYVKFITENEQNTYEVFSVYEIEAENYYLNTEFSDQSFEEFKEKVKQRSKFNFNVDVKNAKQIITLSTCGNSNKNRVVLHAIKLEQ